MAGDKTRAAPRGGFTLIEVLFALGILALGGSSLIALFVHNLREAKRAREEIVINVIQRDVTVRNQLAAFAASAAGKNFWVDVNDWIVKDIDNYNLTVALGDDQRRWENIPAYTGYFFFVDPFERQGAPWSNHAATMGLVLYDNQFVDWDGYGWIDLNNNNQFDDGEDFGDPEPSHKIKYDSRGMRNYMMRMRGIIAWDTKVKVATLASPTGVSQDDLKNRILNGDAIAKYHVFYFTVYNPDTQKH